MARGPEREDAVEQERSGTPDNMDAVRTCVGCGARAPRQELLRVVHQNGCVIWDDRGALPGRGAWLHRDTACIERAIARGTFSRALRVSGKLDTSHIENRLNNMMDTQ